MSLAPTAAAERPVRRIGELPSPFRLPLLGNMLQMDRHRVHHRLERWAREYGTVYRLRFFAREFVVFSDPEAIGTVLRNRPDGFRRPPRVVETTTEFGLNGLFSADGDTWRRQRPLVMAGLDPTHLKAFFPTLTRITQRFSDRWQRAAATGKQVEVLADLMRYTVDVTAGLALGQDINTIEAGANVIQDHLDKLLPSLYRRMIAPVRHWRWLRLPADRALERHVAALRVEVDAVIAATRQRLREQPQLKEQPTNLIEAMVAARDRPGSALIEQDLSGNVVGMLLGGEDTTANTLAWLIWLLHANPDAARRARDEVRRVVGSAGQVTAHEQLGQLDYLDACISEALRMKPNFPLISLQTVRDTVVDGVALTAGTMVLCLIRPPGMAEERFPAPQVFKPERWLQGASLGAPRRTVMPFGAGPRMCPGRYLALAEIKMVLAMLLATFEIESMAFDGDTEPRELLGFTLSPMGLRMRLR